MSGSISTIEPESKADWQRLRLNLQRCYLGVPQGKSGTFPGTVFTLCELLNGHVKIEKDGANITAQARDKVWILTSPGSRFQSFSDDARIVSIHIALDNPRNGAAWIGSSCVAVTPGPAARAALSQLCSCDALQALSQAQRLNLSSIEFSLNDHLEIQSLASRLFYHSMRLAADYGLSYAVPKIQDGRVLQSYRTIANIPLNERFSRARLAQQVGLSPVQLDRLWHKELHLTPCQFWDNLRLNFACEQLRRHNVPIKVIAAELGFRHLSQFSNWFATRHRESPRSFRNRPGAS